MSSDFVLATSKITAAHDFAFKPDTAERAQMAETLGILGIKKLAFAGNLAPSGAKDLKLSAHIGATVIQACVVTTEPVTTRIEEDIVRLYEHGLEMPEGDEVEMPEDDTVEPLPAEIDLSQVMEEALALALPPWPRAKGVAPVDITVTEPGKAPLTDEDTKPFASLKDLRDKLGGIEE